MRELMLDHLGFVLEFLMQDRTSHRPEAVAGNLRTGGGRKKPLLGVTGQR